MNSKPDYNDVFFQLQDYILTDKKIVDATKLCIDVISYSNSNKKQRQQQRPQVSKPAMFEPREKDSLFWCFYIMKNGQTAYDLLDHRNFIVEKKLKIEYVEQIRKEKQLMKTYKFATLTHLESNLANDDRIDIPTFLSLCVFENLNVTVIKKLTYFELLMNDDVEIHTIHCLDNYKYGHSQIIADKESLLKIDNITKPMKSISSYKVSELTDMCEKLKINTINEKTCKTNNKNDLYESIVKYF
jgi:hypothetical protein